MARNINDLYNLALYIVRKNRGVYITPSEFCSALDEGQMEVFEYFFVQYGLNQNVHDALSNFKVRVQFTSLSDGTVVFNDDYLHLLAGVFTVTGSTINPVRFVSSDELPDALTGQLRPVTLSSPIAVDNAGGFYLYPQSQQIGFYTYLRRPKTPVLAFTQVNRTLTYDPYSSIQLEFTDAYSNNILARALKLMGVNMDEAGIEQFAQLQTQQTNS